MNNLNQPASKLSSPPAGAVSNLSLGQLSTTGSSYVPMVEHCVICSNYVSCEYYRINSQMTCPDCASRARTGRPIDSMAAFTRGLLFGIGGAILGLAFYASLRASSGWPVEYTSCAALAVGWLVGQGMISGSKNLGSRHHQVAAVLLTFCAVSIVPFLSVLRADYRNASSMADFASELPAFAVNSLASPFLELFRNPVGGGINLFLLFLNLCIAWHLTRNRILRVDGPYYLGLA